MKKRNILVISILLFLFYGLFTITSCRKPDAPKAIITVIDTAGYAVEGATVKIYINKNGAYIDPKEGVLEHVDYTNASGEVRYESKYEGIRDVYAEIAPDSVTSFQVRTGEGVLVLKEDETYSETIKLR